MKNGKRIIALSVLLIMCLNMLLLSACSSSSSFCGTWSLAKVNYEGTEYSIDEVKALNENTFDSDVSSMINAVIVIKSGNDPNTGTAIVASGDDKATVNWSYSDNILTVGEREGIMESDFLVFEINSDSKLYFKKISDSQDFSATNTDTTITNQAETEEARVKETTKPTEVKKDTTSSSSSNSSSDYDNIISKANTDVESGIAELNSQWESLKNDITSYDSYVKNLNRVESFYETILSKHADLCTIAYNAAIDYAKAIVADSSLDSEKKYKKSKNIDTEIYDDLLETIEEDIYEDLFDDINDTLYDGVLDKSDEAGVDFNDWYDTHSNEYDMWYDTRSDVYDEWYDSRSDIYDFYYDISSEFYSNDTERVQALINKFQGKIDKR